MKQDSMQKEKKKSNQKSARQTARIAVVQGLYQFEVSEQNCASIAREFIDHRFETAVVEGQDLPADQVYFQKLLEAIPFKIDVLDEEISKHLQEKWSMARLDSVVRALLRCAAYELMFEKSVPTPVVLNEYIEVGRSFFDEREVKFINGILDSIAKAVRSTKL